MKLACAALAVTVGLLAPAPARAADTPQLARPTGPHPELVRPTGHQPVGTAAIHLTDTSRPDPWVPGSAARELMVTVWYPAAGPGGRRARYMSPRESELYLAGKRITDLPADTLSRVRTYAYTDARPAGRAHSLPLVVLSPGYTQPRGTLTGLAEDLASHGYVVAGIDHTHETYAVTFPGGRIATCAACELTEDDAFFRKLYAGRAADVSFVLDRLTGPKPAWRGSSLIDASRIAMSGHSAGGASAIAAMAGDPRIDAGIDMDGTTRGIVPSGGLSRPFLFLGTQAEHSPGGRDVSWDDDWKRLTGWRRWIVVAGAVHGSFTDLTLLADQLGIDLGATITGTRSLELTRRYNRAFFDRHLRHRPQPLLDRASPRYPEVIIAAR
ncbi:alpha/beta hydrolase family protein [Actinoplanes sp. CA-051413]|uniref:alpha/beta hydrolase family protein n=1 Tax=Actinoplanes sp. CA-051413 TaxID=3239899 RepID=UPI003D95EEB6